MIGAALVALLLALLGALLFVGPDGAQSHASASDRVARPERGSHYDADQ